jgi:hypothetical protein
VASLAQLQNDVAGWLNRQDFIAAGLFPSWVSIAETQMAETLRARCMFASAIQDIDAPSIQLPSDFATMAAIRDNVSGANLELKDEWSPKGGGWQAPYAVYTGTYPSTYWMINPASPCYAYRIVGNCIEFLPQPDIPDPTHVFQQVLMTYYQKPRPLILPTDTNPILEQLYSVYLYALIRLGAMWALDDARAQQMDAAWQQAVTQANLHKQQSDLSGAPLRSEPAVVF